jgi:hypothetical protein
VYPGEEDAVNGALCWAMGELPEEVKDRFDYDLLLPLDIEINLGPNWMEQNEIALTNATN